MALFIPTRVGGAGAIGQPSERIGKEEKEKNGITLYYSDVWDESSPVANPGPDEDEPLDSVERSSQNRLDNGNTLIVESMAGRLIEVTPEGDIVWEFVNPVRGGAHDQRIPIIFWVDRLDPESYFTGEFAQRLTAG